MDKEIRADVIERTLSPLGWHLLGKANLKAAEHLVASGVRLRFEDPIRSLFAHAWELNLKACLRRQGLPAEAVRIEFGHDLLQPFSENALWARHVLTDQASHHQTPPRLQRRSLR